MLAVVLLFLCLQTISGLPLDSNQKDAPWHIYLDISGLRCGGSLIKNKYVITAAHCFDAYLEEFKNDLSHFKIYIGEWKIGMDPDCSDDDSDEVCDYVIKTTAAALKIHEKYNKNNRDKHNYDIAIITLKSVPRTSDIVSSVLLPDGGCDENLTGKDFSISGFGETRPQVKAVIRKKIDIKIFDHGKCLSAFENKKYNSKSHMCGAGKNGLSTCKGDSGGGAVKQIADDEDEIKTYLYGIVSFGSNMCGDGKPTGLLKVSCFTEWINGVINPSSVSKQKSKANQKTTPPPSNNDEDEEDGGY